MFSSLKKQAEILYCSTNGGSRGKRRFIFSKNKKKKKTNVTVSDRIMV